MRLNYYRFPEGIDAKTRYINGADFIEGQYKKTFSNEKI